jgi:xylan 1,4-beta-xylosidase
MLTEGVRGAADVAALASVEAKLTHHRIDEHHSNAYAAWKRMGSPIAPDRDQYGELETASRLVRLEEPRMVGVAAGRWPEFTLPRQP